MKPATVLQFLQGMEALFEAARLAASSPLAVAAVLRAIASEAQRLQSKMEHSRQANKARQAELVLMPAPTCEQKNPVEAINANAASLPDSSRTKLTATQAMEVGRRFLLIKATSPHGAYSSRLKELGYSPVVVSRYLRTAMRFADAPNIVEAARSASGLHTLLCLDDDEILELNRGEAVRGLTLDAIRGMTVAELRGRLRTRIAK